MSNECDMCHTPSAPCAKCEARIAAKTAVDHGISPAQLREKVEALVERANSDADKHNRLCDVVAEQMRRLDAALKRIEELEKQIAAWRGTSVWKNDPALTVTHVDSEHGVVTLERKP